MTVVVVCYDNTFIENVKTLSKYRNRNIGNTKSLHQHTGN